MKIKNIFLSLSLIVLLGASALAQTGNDVSVKIVNKEGKVIATSNLDRNGNFNFPDLPAGDYKLKVAVQDFQFLKINAISGDKGTNGQNSTGRKGITQSGVKKNEDVAIPENAEVRKGATQKIRAVDQVSENRAVDMHIKMQSVEAASVNDIYIKIDQINGLAASDFFLKFKGDLAAQEKSNSGLKDTLKTQVRVSQPASVQVESWSWGASNSLVYQSSQAKLKEGVEVQISVKEKKNFSGHVTVLK